MDVTSRARAGGLARAAALPPDERRRIGRDAYLAGAVRTITRRIEELSEEQVQALAQALGRRDDAA